MGGVHGWRGRGHRHKRNWKPPVAEAVLCWIPGQGRNDIRRGLVCCALVSIRWSLVNRVGNELPTLRLDPRLREDDKYDVDCCLRIARCI